jgi:hypothetical protein
VVASLLSDPESAAQHVEQLAPLIASDRSLSGRAILDKLVAFLLSPAGEETRAQLAAGLRSNGNHSLDLARAIDLASMAGRLHPEFRTSTLIGALGGYLLSEDGKQARNQLLVAGTQRVVDGLTGALNRLARPTPAPTRAVALAESE